MRLPSAEKQAEIINKLYRDIDAANSHYESKIEPKLTDYYDIYNATQEFYQKKFPRLSQNSDMTSTDVRDTIEWALPAIMKLYFASTDLISIEGQQGNDDANAKTMQELINYQLQRKNKAFTTFYTWFKDAFITNVGILKGYWEREEKTERMKVSLAPEQYLAFVSQEGVKVISESMDPFTGTYLVEYDHTKVIKNQPCIENILASEFRFSGDATNIDTCPFVAHKKRVTVDYLRKQAKSGRYDKERVAAAVEKVGADDTKQTVLDEQRNPDIRFSSDPVDKGRAYVDLYECYINMTLDDDEEGLLQPYIVHVCKKEILSLQENTYDRHPFFLVSPSIDPHKIWPDGGGFADSLANIQHIKTAVQKQVLHSLALANNPQIGIDVGRVIDLNDVITGKSVIRFKDGTDTRQAMSITPTANVNPITLSLLQYWDAVAADRTGISDYTKGQDAGNGLNDTATGISIITQSANKRLELIGRMFLESGVIPLYRHLITLNQKFIDQETVIRLTDKTLVIAPDNLSGDFDLIPQGSLGINNKEQKMAVNAQLQAVVEKLAQVQLAGPQQFFNTAKRILEELEINNIDDYAIDPSQQMQQMQGGMPGAGAGQAAGIGPDGGQGQFGPVGPGLPQPMGGVPQTPVTPGVGPGGY